MAFTLRMIAGRLLQIGDTRMRDKKLVHPSNQTMLPIYSISNEKLLVLQYTF